MSLLRRKTRRPQRSSVERTRRRRQKPTSSGVPTRMAEAVGQFMSRFGGQSAGKNKRKKPPTPRRPRPTKIRTVDPGPGSPERQRIRQARRLNRANASVKRRLAGAKRLTNVATKAKKGTKNIQNVLAAAKTAAGRTRGSRSKRGPRA